MDSKSIFRSGSTTYYFASQFFPKKELQDITTLYAFVRTADDFVDAIPQDVDGFHRFIRAYKKGIDKGHSDDKILGPFISLSKRVSFDPHWTDSFLWAMEQDLSIATYATWDQLCTYIYGSAEVIGLYLSQILKLPTQSRPYAQKLGFSMQYINFIRDIKEDLSLGRQYLPIEHLKAYSLSSLAYTPENEEKLSALIRWEIAEWRTYEQEARTGFSYIPRRYRIPIQTASDMYAWTAKTIEYSPMIVYEKKVKPSKYRVLFQGIINTLIA